MSLEARSPYPHDLCYVLKVHRRSNSPGGQVQGLLEHVASGQVIHFESGAALQAALTAHVDSVYTGAGPHGGAKIP